MTVLPILKYPHPFLRQCVEDFEFPEDISSENIPMKALSHLNATLADLWETLYDCPGAIGLAAPQVALPMRLFILDLTAKTTRSEQKVIINPVILQQSKQKMVREGCLSFPDYLANIKRSLKLTLAYRNEHGQPVEEEFRDLGAIAVQHEIDHLNGVLLIDQVACLKSDWIRRRGLPPIS
ncbi:MAG: peptide deformylase [Cyanobacteria bacterium]|nr:peptide deformylase [Cyanobacteriota bacterium]